MRTGRSRTEDWSRRDFMRNGSYSIALLCSFGTPSALKGNRITTSAAHRAQARSPFAPFQRDLPVMPELKPTSTRGGRDLYDVAIRDATAEILPGFQTPIYGYNGLYPGPTIRARKGRPAIVRQRNRLSFDTNVHLHGGYVPSAHDGHPMDVIAPGAGFDYTYPNDQDGAFLWYHDHAHGRTSWTLYHGLVGAYLLGDEREQDLELPQGEYDVPLVLADHAFNKDGSFRYAENVDLGFRGDTLLVNGAVSPRMAVKRRIYRLRFLNASNARSYELQLGQGRQMLQIASDGGLLESPVARSSFPLHPAERIEVLVDFRSFKPGSQLILKNTAGEATTTAVMRFDVVDGGGVEEARMPQGPMRTIEAMPKPKVTRNWDLSLATASGIQWQIANKGFDPVRIDVRPRLGTSELWTWHNPSNRVHPMHLHGMLFRVVKRSSGTIHRGERGLKDTVGVLAGETVTVQPYFGPYAGRYVFHCHALEHGDKAMMLQLEVDK
ncbi:multicopper oxidase domain-containing protein [Solirubrobacter taibaiensis]|nr:multicopper oxidase domain-containing protein [Solirubrobacter taibaiensis]